jgi:hypothetical protein
LFALDQNFPQPIVDVLAEYIIEAELVPIAQVHERMATLDDWEVMLALHQDDRPWDGLITTDANMLALPHELAVLMQTELTLVVAKESGHDLINATGLLLAYLPGICQRTQPDMPQLWTLRAVQRQEVHPGGKSCSSATRVARWQDHDRLAARRLLGFSTAIAREITAKSSRGILNRPTRNMYPQRRLSLMKLSWSISGLIGASMPLTNSMLRRHGLNPGACSNW